VTSSIEEVRGLCTGTAASMLTINTERFIYLGGRLPRCVCAGG
jgi:hypothetical protein